ncbi:unnamed protein product [Spirodela intermedia]|uniref:BHLH domain-containing protein n=1 Tax=Spirodela intermedia TaxID=51605 RepID=A0A7I8KBJ0_SPIIN|nr:unnamed protein product [Spirodela intermedia]
MALEAVVFPSESFNHGGRDLCTVTGGTWGYDFGALGEGETLAAPPGCGVGDGGGGAAAEMGQEPERRRTNWVVSSPSPDDGGGEVAVFAGDGGAAEGNGRRKRRRARTCKNREDVENQRMTHIAVERNRRKQMNQYFSVLRSLMPLSYVQRGDQASIIGGAINFVKELEQLLHFLEAQRRTHRPEGPANGGAAASPFSKFFTFPQYSASAALSSSPSPPGGTAKPPPADIEVTMVESHANLKILSRRRPRHLINTVAGLQSLRLSVLHLNVTSHDQTVLYSFSLKVEDECQLSTVEEIAAAVNQMLMKIQEEAGV